MDSSGIATSRNRATSILFETCRYRGPGASVLRPPYYTPPPLPAFPSPDSSPAPVRTPPHRETVRRRGRRLCGNLPPTVAWNETPVWGRTATSSPGPGYLSGINVARRSVPRRHAVESVATPDDAQRLGPPSRTRIRPPGRARSCGVARGVHTVCLFTVTGYPSLP